MQTYENTLHKVYPQNRKHWLQDGGLAATVFCHVKARIIRR